MYPSLFNTLMQNNNLKIGLAGAGYWGENLVRVFNQLGVLRVVCDKSREVLERVNQNYPNLETTQNFAELLKNKELQALVIATPAATHYKLTKQGLGAGKHIFVEKPSALDITQGEELVKMAEEKGLLLMVGHLLLYHPAIVKLKGLVEKGELGDIKYIYSNRLNFGKLRSEENVLWSFAPHDISIIIDFLGKPEEVLTVGKTYLQKNIPDLTLTFLEFKDNKAAHIFVSWLNPFKEQKFSVVGDKKMAVYDGVKNKLIVFPHKVEWDGNNVPQAIKAEGEEVTFPQKEPLMEEAKHFLECLKENKTPRTNGKEGLAVLEVLYASQKSLQSKEKQRC